MTSKRRCSWAEQEDFQEFRSSVLNNIHKLLDSADSGAVLRSASEWGFHRFFGMGRANAPWFDEAFRQWCRVLDSLDVLLGLSSFKEYLRETGKAAKERDVVRLTKLFAFCLVFGRRDWEFTLAFARAFLPEKWSGVRSEEFQEALRGMTGLSPAASPDFRPLLEGMLPFFDERGPRLCLGLAHAAEVLGNDETLLADFLVWLNKKGLRLKIEHSVRALGIE